MGTEPDRTGLAHLLRFVQDGVVSRRQLERLGFRPHDLERMLRRRELSRVHPGVFVDHTGPLTRDQRAWTAVLVHEPAALTRRSALPGPPGRAPIEVAVDARRAVRPVDGVVAHRTTRLAARIDPLSSPPRLRLEDAAIEEALRCPSAADAYTLLADLCHTRRTTPARLAAEVRSRPRVRRRGLLLELLDDLALGACSVLEREYLHRVERRHGLPAGSRQVRDAAGARTAYRDVDHPAWGLVVELDGRQHAVPSARRRDLERDLDVAVRRDRRTVRLGHAQVLDDACRTAAAVAALLQRGGWPGRLVPCEDCPVTGA
ncbi:hypothetical protein AB0N29_16065 [Nocardioides sp. NPDC092400]|uniref:hypothetical protein n=1 Tax=Nocardioides sp. NPDC092400 TaxID=3155196 RepID=UPI00343C5E47